MFIVGFFFITFFRVSWILVIMPNVPFFFFKYHPLISLRALGWLLHCCRTFFYLFTSVLLWRWKKKNVFRFLFFWIRAGRFSWHSLFFRAHCCEFLPIKVCVSFSCGFHLPLYFSPDNTLNTQITHFFWKRIFVVERTQCGRGIEKEEWSLFLSFTPLALCVQAAAEGSEWV